MADNRDQRSFFVSLLAFLSFCSGGCFKKRVPKKREEKKSFKLFGWLRGCFGRRIGKPKNNKASCVQQCSKPEHIQEEPEKKASVNEEPVLPVSCVQQYTEPEHIQEEPEKKASVDEEPVLPASCVQHFSKPEHIQEEPEKKASVNEEPVLPVSCVQQYTEPEHIQEEPEKKASVDEEPVLPASCVQHCSKPEHIQEEPEKKASVNEEPVLPVSCVQQCTEPEHIQEEPEKKASVDEDPVLPVRKKAPGKKRTRNRTYLKKIKEIVTPGDPNMKYAVTNKIGEGVDGSVYMATDLNLGIVAIKKIWISQQYQQKNALEEIIALRDNTHPNIINYVESYLVGDELWIVMEYVDGGCLRDLSANTCMKEPQIAIVARECLQALQFLHQNNVIHRDVKTENILFGLDGSIKLADFGLCANVSDDESERTSYVGTPHMMAPEIVTDKPYSYKVDIWSLGITTLEMLDYKHPFLAQDTSDALDFIANTGKPKIENPTLSSEVQDFLEKCLEVDSANRSSASELLGHPFLQMASSLADLQQLIMDVKQAIQ